ncbi:hypothetical protein [Pulveribacter sp.]|uniref:hypothetical protein n=1 Tax=Pulveribacter sp. TaxID=2678893 RepID=UPI0028ABC383|nr:hypothetical protein [Pulveribacter sp.]
MQWLLAAMNCPALPLPLRLLRLHCACTAPARCCPTGTTNSPRTRARAEGRGLPHAQGLRAVCELFSGRFALLYELAGQQAARINF